MINGQTSRLLAASMSPTLGIFRAAPPFASCCGARVAFGTFSIKQLTIKDPSLPRSAPASGSCGQVEPKQLWRMQSRLNPWQDGVVSRTHRCTGLSECVPPAQGSLLSRVKLIVEEGLLGVTRFYMLSVHVREGKKSGCTQVNTNILQPSTLQCARPS